MELIEELYHALDSMLVATDDSAELPPGHPGHEAYLCTVAKPRAKAALLKYKESAKLEASMEEKAPPNNAMFELLCDIKEKAVTHYAMTEQSAILVRSSINAVLAQQKHS